MTDAESANDVAQPRRASAIKSAEPDAKSRGMPSAARRTLYVAKIVVSVSLLGLLLNWIDLKGLLSRFAALDWSWLVAGLALHQTQTAISALKWRIILRADGENRPYPFLLKTCLIGNFLSLFLPTSFGGDVYRVWALSQRGIKTRKGTASVLLDRLSGILALMTIGSAGLVLLVSAGQATIVLCVYMGVIACLAIGTSDGFIARLPSPTSKYLGFPVRVLQSFNHYRREPRQLVVAMALSIMFQLNVVLIVTCYARALAVPVADISTVEMFAAVPLVHLTEIIPLSINGIGIRDGAFAYLFERFGGTVDQGFAVSMLVIALRYLLGLVGGVLLFFSTIRSRRLEGTSSFAPVTPSHTRNSTD